MNRNRIAALLVTLVLVAAIGTSAALISAAQGPDRLGELRTVLEVVALVRNHYVDPINAVDLLSSYVRTGTINGMLRETVDDPYTRYMDPQAYAETQVDITGEFGGLGLYVGMRDGKLTVIAPIPGTPAQRAGLLPGDHIAAIDGRPTLDMSQDEAVSRMRGQPGTSVTLTITRDDASFDVDLVRAQIDVPAVSQARLLPGEAGIGYIRLLQFSEKAGPELGSALSRLQQQGMRGLVLDLRNNPGGLLSAAIDVANYFIDSGPIVHMVGRDGQRRTVEAFPREVQYRVPTVVLVNQYSASASEIVAGALRDRGVARLVGVTTFGKGLVQTVIPLRGGAALSLTTARYQTAGGHFIDQKGIEPDVVVEVPEEQAQAFLGVNPEEIDTTDPQLLKAIEVVTEQIAVTPAQRAKAL